jgi:3-methyladenine DNA glycosylase Tag
VQQRKKQLEKAKRKYYHPSEEEKNVWLPDMSDEEYFMLPEEYHSSSRIMQHFRQDAKSAEIFERVKKYTPALQMGSLIHAHILTPEILPDLKHLEEDLEERFGAVEVPEGAEPKVREVNGKTYKTYPKRKPSALERVERAVDAAFDDTDIMAALEGADREFAGLLEDFHGIKVRIKADAIHFGDGVLIDVKTSTKSLKAFHKEVLSDEPLIPYRQQAALYLDVANELNRLSGIPTRFDKFIWAFVSTSKAETGIVECPDEILEVGRQEYLQYIKDIKENG